MAPAGSNPEMWLVNGKYDTQLHHNSHRAVGVPGTVAGLHLAWKTYGSKPWKDLVEPSVKLARDGFEMSDGLARSLARMVETSFKKYPASLAQFSKNGTPYQAGELFKQPDLARSLQRIADQGPAGFYEGETAALIEKEMKANGGLITREDLKNYQAKQRAPITGRQARARSLTGVAAVDLDRAHRYAGFLAQGRPESCVDGEIDHRGLQPVGRWDDGSDAQLPAALTVRQGDRSGKPAGGRQPAGNTCGRRRVRPGSRNAPGTWRFGCQK